MAHLTPFPTQFNTGKDARGIRLGEILVEQGLLSRDEVKQILDEQRQQGRPFGVLAERLFGLDPRDIEAAWVRQYVELAGTIDPIVLDVDRACVTLINRRQAWQFHLGVVGREDGELVLVTDEKHLARALRFAAGTFKEPTFVRVTDATKLNEFLMDHYPVPTFIAEYAESR
jgi:hypothetical protein